MGSGESFKQVSFYENDNRILKKQIESDLGIILNAG